MLFVHFQNLHFEKWTDIPRKRDIFLCYGKLRKIDLAVLHCLNANETWIGKQHPVGVAHFFMLWEIAQIRRIITQIDNFV